MFSGQIVKEQRKRGLEGPFIQMSINAGNGVLSVSLYFADLLSDVQVVQLLFVTGNTVWAWTSTTIHTMITSYLTMMRHGH